MCTKKQPDKSFRPRIRMASELSLQHYGKPLICTYSGGKDSDVMLELFKRSGIPFEVHNSHTTADIPQTVRHIRNTFRDLENQGIKCNIEIPIHKGEYTSMWKLIPLKLMPPTRIVRYCCSILKESGCNNRYIATGVRWDESAKRSDREAFEKLGNAKKYQEKFSDMMFMNDNDARRRMVELCMLKKKMVVNPIIDWTHAEVWEYIRSESVKICDLYEMGYERVGCIGCPLAGKRRWKEFLDFPKFKEAYIRAFDRMLLERKKSGLACKWECGDDVFHWWMEDENIKGQMHIEDYL